MALLHSNNVQVHKVAMHLPVAGRRVPAAHGEDFQALHGLKEEFKRNQSDSNM